MLFLILCHEEKMEYTKSDYFSINSYYSCFSGLQSLYG